MDILLNIEQITSPNNVLGLRRLYDKVESNVRALGALGVAQESYGTMLSSVLVKKLPQEIRLMVSQKVTDDWDMKAIMDVLGDELEARERAVTTKEGVVDHDKSSRDKERSSATTLFTNSSKNQASDSCCYCRNEHPSSSCTVVTSREERTKILCTSGRCFNCLRRGHRERDCRSRTRCRACNGRHHSSICQVRSGPVEDKKLPQVDHKSPSNTQLNPGAPSFAAAQSKSTSCCLAEGHETVLLQTARASLYNPEGPGNTVEVSLIFDSGSQQSYIFRDTSKQLGLRIHGKKILSIATFGTNSELQQPCDMVRVGIMTAEGGTKEISLLSVPVICQPLASLPAHTCLHKYEGLHLNLADAASERKSPIQPAILIGLDHYWQFMTGETIHCGETGPVASRTVLGWVVSGPVPTDMGSAYGNTYLSTHTLKVTASSGRESTQRLEQQLKTFWDLESLGVCDSEKTVYDQFHDMVKFNNGRYEVQLPWKDPMSTIPDNYELCLKRLHSLLRRLRQNPKLFEQYDKVIRDQIKNDIVQTVELPERVEGNRVHYLPHHAVVTKVRVVYDASAKMTGPSLNECLHVGPKFNQKILDILIRFRLHKVAIVADIEKAFLMIAVDEKDRDVLRFLWFRDITKEPLDLVVLRFARVTFGVSSSPFLLNATIRHHLDVQAATQEQLVKRLQESIYVDDILTGVEDVETAWQLYLHSKEILKTGGFNLRKFKTNDSDLQRRMTEAEGTIPYTSETNDNETYAKSMLGKSQKPCMGEQKTLGLRWHMETDQFIFDLNEITRVSDATPIKTKRSITSIVSKIYDPLGILSPVVIPFKLFFKELCAEKGGMIHSQSGCRRDGIHWSKG